MRMRQEDEKSERDESGDEPNAEMHNVTKDEIS